MASYTRLGSYMLSSELAADPLGKIYRGLSLTGSAFERHQLIRTFSDEIADAGFSARIAEVQRLAGLLAGTRGFGANYVVEAGRAPHVICDYIPGRSLAQVLQKTREEQIPLGVDHSLSVLQGLAQSLMALASKDVHHGALSTHSIWVSFEGATHIIDAPYGTVLASLLPKAKGLEAALAPYRSPGLTGLQQDLFALGSVLYEMLTLEKLPAREAIPAALSRATLKAAQEDGAVPPEIIALLKKVLLTPEAFATVGAFNQELESVLYDGDYSPTTFNMAFFMHTLFREESDQDGQSMKADQGADYTPFLPSDEGSRRMLVAPDGTSRAKYFVYGGAALLVAFSVMGYMLYSNNRRTEDLQAKIAELQREKTANDNKIVDITKQEEVQKQLQDQLAKKATEAKTVEERTKAKKELEEAKAKTEELAREKDEALKKKQDLANQGNVIVANAQKAAPAPAAAQPAPVQAPPPTPAPVAPPAPQAMQVATPVAQDVPDTAASFLNRVTPATPHIANKAFLPQSLRGQDIKVILRVFVDAKGNPVKVVFVQGVSGPFGYNDAAQKATLDSTYTAATHNGKPISSWLTVEYLFPKP